ncbi:MAG: lasso peptide biosynthesis B2 protein [Pseudomonadales bacterium]
MSKLSKLAGLGAADWYCLLWAALALPVVDIILRSRGVASARRWAMVPLGKAGEAQATEKAMRWGWLINGAASSGLYRVSCLRRSLVLLRYMRRHGLVGELKVGVPRGGELAPDLFEAHAWVELDGVVVNDVAEVSARYVCFELPRA